MFKEIKKISIFLLLLCNIFFCTIKANDIETNENIEKEIENNDYSYIFVGDSRTVMAKSAYNNTKEENTKDTNIFFIGKIGSGINWLKESAIQDVENTIANEQRKGHTPIVVFWFGVNDLDNINCYIEFYENFSKEHDNCMVLLPSVGQVDEKIEEKNGYKVKNKDINIFNEKLDEAFGFQYIDIQSCITKEYTVGNTKDGVHYDEDTSNRYVDYIKRYISEMNYEVYCK